MALTMKRLLGRVLLISLAALAILFAGDWTVFRVRGAQAISSVQVDQFLRTPLKGQKEEFDYMGTVAQPCAHTIFPQQSLTPCWWLQSHKTQWVSP